MLNEKSVLTKWGDATYLGNILFFLCVLRSSAVQ